MPIPHTNCLIRQSDIYPDRVEVAFEYSFPREVDWQHFYDAATGLEGYQLSHGRKIQIERVLPDVGIVATFKMVRRGPNGPLYVTVELNALSVLHDQRSDYGNERGANHETNWLHPEAIRPHVVAISGMLNHLVTAAEGVVQTIGEELADALWFPPTLVRLLSTNIKEIELAVDLATESPNHMVQAVYAQRIASICRKEATRRYDQPAFYVSGPDGDALCTHGYAASGVVLKAYTKTNARVRLEAVLSRKCLSTLGLSRTVQMGDIWPTVLPIIDCVWPHFKRELSPRRT